MKCNLLLLFPVCTIVVSSLEVSVGQAFILNAAWFHNCNNLHKVISQTSPLIKCLEDFITQWDIIVS